MLVRDMAAASKRTAGALIGQQSNVNKHARPQICQCKRSKSTSLHSHARTKSLKYYTLSFALISMTAQPLCNGVAY